MEWRLRRVVPAAAVTTYAKPHAQQQLPRDLEVDGCISCELQLYKRGYIRNWYVYQNFTFRTE